MPELPEVETMRRGILGTVGGTIASVNRCSCKLKRIQVSPRIDVFRRRAVGQEVIAVDRIGKRVVLRLANEHAIVYEPRMTGLVLVADPPNIEHLRFCVELAGSEIPRIWFWDRRGLGSVHLFSREQFNQRLGPEKLGPDALAISPETLREQFRTSRREVKVALLDQRAVAGIGNLYASEILHLAGVHPRHRCDRVTKERWAHIHKAMVDVLETAIRFEGSTLSDGTYRNALNEAGGYQNQHRVYDRRGESCPTCGQAAIERIVQAQRSTFFCPHCQTKRRKPR